MQVDISSPARDHDGNKRIEGTVSFDADAPENATRFVSALCAAIDAVEKRVRERKVDQQKLIEKAGELFQLFKLGKRYDRYILSFSTYSYGASDWQSVTTVTVQGTHGNRDDLYAVDNNINHAAPVFFQVKVARLRRTNYGSALRGWRVGTQSVWESASELLAACHKEAAERAVRLQLRLAWETGRSFEDRRFTARSSVLPTVERLVEVIKRLNCPFTARMSLVTYEDVGSAEERLRVNGALAEETAARFAGLFDEPEVSEPVEYDGTRAAVEETAARFAGFFDEPEVSAPREGVSLITEPRRAAVAVPTAADNHRQGAHIGLPRAFGAEVIADLANRYAEANGLRYNGTNGYSAHLFMAPDGRISRVTTRELREWADIAEGIGI